MTEKMYPIQHGYQIPWGLIAPHEDQAIRNHGQTLERLAHRCGTCWEETYYILNSQKFPAMGALISEHDAREYIFKRVSEYNGMIALREALKGMLESYDILTSKESPFVGNEIALGCIQGAFLNAPVKAREILGRTS